MDPNALPLTTSSQAMVNNYLYDWESHRYELVLMQGPERARLSSSEVDRRTVTPAPILRLRALDQHGNDVSLPLLHHLRVFVLVELLDPVTNVRIQHMIPSGQEVEKEDNLFGYLVANYIKVNRHIGRKDLPPFFAAMFYFPGDLNIRQRGTYRLRFTAVALHNGTHRVLASVLSGMVEVYGARNFPGMGARTKEEDLLKEHGAKVRGNRQKKIRGVAGRKFSTTDRPQHHPRQFVPPYPLQPPLLPVPNNAELPRPMASHLYYEFQDEPEPYREQIVSTPSSSGHRAGAFWGRPPESSPFPPFHSLPPPAPPPWWSYQPQPQARMNYGDGEWQQFVPQPQPHHHYQPPQPPPHRPPHAPSPHRPPYKGGPNPGMDR